MAKDDRKYKVVPGKATVEANGVKIDATLLTVGFVGSADTDEIGRDAEELLAELRLPGGALVLLNGPAALVVAMGLAHDLGHLYGAVAGFDPKIAAYVVAIAHGGQLARWDRIPASAVTVDKEA